VLFDYYVNKMTDPAFLFGLQVSRQSLSSSLTCQSGGFIASRSSSPDKSPIPFLPKGIETFPNEGFGEVQTPLRIPEGLGLSLGDPIFFRPAKAGEIAERFNYYLIKQGNTISKRVKTYRGLGYNFF